MVRPEKQLEDMSIDELKEELARVNKLTNFNPKKRQVGEDGAIILDSNDPHGREWYEDDEDKNQLEQRTFHCDRCGRYHEKTDVMDFAGNLFHQMRVHFGYSSPFDTEILEFSICELCLMNFLSSFKHRPTVDNQDIVDSFNELRKKDHPFYEDYFIKTYKRLEGLGKK